MDLVHGTGQPSPVGFSRQLIDAGKEARKQRYREAVPIRVAQPVYHGTPHVWAPEPGFPHGRPRLDKIGTGEGAHSYGWGWYSADAEAVSDYYRPHAFKQHRRVFIDGVSSYDFYNSKALSEPPKKGDIYYGLDEALGFITHYVRRHSDEQRGLEEARAVAEKLGDKDVAAAAAKFLFENHTVTVTPDFTPPRPGATYKLDLPDEVIPKLLVWDKPFSQQPGYVKLKLKQAGFTVLPGEDPQGSVIHAIMRGKRKSVEEKSASDHLLSIGIPGLRYLDQQSRSKGEGSYNYVIWDQQVLDKIALLERNGEKLDAIRELDQYVVAQSQALYDTEPPSRQQPLFENPAPAYDLPQMDRVESVRRLLQDRFIDIRRLVEAIRESGRAVPDELNPVLREEMYLGRVAQANARFLNDELGPLVRTMQLQRFTIPQLDEYLHARHAKEANAYLQSINPDMPDNEALSGMSDADADEILENADPRLAKLAEKVDAIIAGTRQLMVEYGLESQDTVDGWVRQYSAYVPLHRAGFEDDVRLGTGQGRSVRGSTVKPRLGSTRDVIDILANIALDRERVITRGEKMRPVVALAGLLMQYPNRDIATLAKPAPIIYTNPQTGLLERVPGDVGEYQVPRIRWLNPKTGTVEFRPDPSYKGRDNVVNFRINGVDYALVFNEHNARAVEMATALKDLDVGHLNTLLSTVAPITRYFASINTQYNPIFGLVNFIRDIQFAMLALSSTPLAGQRAEIAKHALRAITGIYQDARAVRKGQHPTSPVAQLWERFQAVGGPTGYRDLFRNSADRARAIEHMLDPDWWQKTMAGKALTANGLLARPESLIFSKGGKWLLEWLSDYNQTMENAVRLGVFQAGLDQGMSDIRAASLAKNITVNFNKKGQISAQAGAVYAFFNASVQGTTRLAETLFEPGKMGALSAAGKKIVIGGVTLGVAQAFALMMAGFGEDEPPEWLRARSIIVPAPGTDKGYLSFPMPLGFNVLPNLGRLAAESLWHGRPIERAYRFMAAAMDSLSPLGGASSTVQLLTPTVADPLIDLYGNRDWTGRQIYKEDFDSRKPTPGFTRTKTTATPWARGLSEAINYATGGTAYVPGKFSPTPDQIDYLIAQATGGIGREVSKAARAVTALATGEDLPLSTIPLVGRFAGSSTGTTAVREQFYRNMQHLYEVKAEVDGRREHHERVTEYLEQHPEHRLVGLASLTDRQISQLQKRKRELLEKGSRREQVKQLEQQMTASMARLNDRVAALWEPEPQTQVAAR
jgi:hypothetical protein